MNYIIQFTIIWLVTLIFHEFGHYIGYIICKKKPFFTFKWYGIIYADCVNRMDLKLREYSFIALNGIWFGWFCIMFCDITFQLVYLLTCCIDLTIILSIMNEKDKNITLFQNLENDYFKAKEDKIQNWLKNGNQ